MRAGLRHQQPRCSRPEPRWPSWNLLRGRCLLGQAQLVVHVSRTTSTVRFPCLGHRPIHGHGGGAGLPEHAGEGDVRRGGRACSPMLLLLLLQPCRGATGRKGGVGVVGV